eukprot:gene9167-10758_t
MNDFNLNLGYLILQIIYDPRKLPAFATLKPPNNGESNQPSSMIVDDYVQSDTDASEYSDGEDGAPTTPSFNYLARKRNSLSIGARPSTSVEGNSRGGTATSSQFQQLLHPPIIKKHAPSSYGSLGEHHHRHGGVARGRSGGSVTPKTINPFTYDATPFHLTSNRRRWSHLWFSPNTYIFGKTNANPNPFLPNWKSLCEPASLPITTDYFPSNKDLLTKYSEYVHTLTLSPDENEYHNNTEALLKELISQRLAQGYQLIMADGPPSTATGQSKMPSSRKTYQLSLGHDFHVVTYDPGNFSVQVKRYQRHGGRRAPNDIRYIYFLCTVYHTAYIPQKTTLSHQASGTYPWNSLDNLICGTIAEIKNTLLTTPAESTTPALPSSTPTSIPNATSPVQSPPLSPSTSTQQPQLNFIQNPVAPPISSMNIGIGGSISAPTSPIPSHKSMTNLKGTINPVANSTNTYNKPNITSPTPMSSQEMPSAPSTTEGLAVLTEHSEEERIASFGKFKDYINSLIAKNSNPALVLTRMEVKPVTGAQLTSLETAVLEMPATSCDLTDEYSVMEKLLPSNLNAIFNRMNMAPPVGIKMVDKKYRLRTYRKCFISSEFIDWILQNVEVGSREDATNICLEMAELKLIKSVEKTQFVDGFYYYRLKEDSFINNLRKKSDLPPAPLPAVLKTSVNQPNNNSSLGMLNGGSNESYDSVNNQSNNSNNNNIKSSGGIPNSPPPNNAKKDSTSPPVDQQSSPRLQRHLLSSSYFDTNTGGSSPLSIPSNSLRNSVGGTPQQLYEHSYQNTLSTSQSIGQSSSTNITDNYENPNACEEQKIEMDPSKTDRYEWIMMKYDKSFSPTRYYHIEFKWMVCTGCVVDDFISSCIRKAKQFGLTFIQIPIEKNYSPFYAPIHVKLVSKLMQPEVIRVILAQFNFIPDLLRKRAASLVTRNDLYLFNDSDVVYTEYIHRTGMLFVRVVESGFLCIVNNAPSNRPFLPAALLCLKAFQELVGQLNSTMPSIIYHTPDSPSLLADDSFLNGGSPQTNLLRSLPPQEANFLALFASGYTAGDGSDTERHNNNNSQSSPDNSPDQHNTKTHEHLLPLPLTQQQQYEESMWESQEILYYSLMSRSPTI